MKKALLFLWFFMMLFFFVNNQSTIEFNVPKQQIDNLPLCLQGMLDLHNKIRKSNQLRGLEMDRRLCEYAQKHAENMSRTNRIGHSSMVDLQVFCGNALVGENIAWGQDDEDSVVSSWMKSRSHRRNILGSYKKAGFGVKKDASGRKYWCAVFSG